MWYLIEFYQCLVGACEEKIRVFFLTLLELDSESSSQWCRMRKRVRVKLHSGKGNTE